MTRKKQPYGKPKRVYLGDDVWETTFENGEVEFEILTDDEEHAALEAAAAKAGLTVSELVKNRILKGEGVFGYEAEFALDRFIFEYTCSVENICKDLATMQNALETISRQRKANLPVSVETVTALVSCEISQLQALKKAIAEIDGAAQECPEVLAQSRVLEAAIAKTLTVILETGIVSA